MNKVEAFSLLASFAQAKAEGRKVTINDPKMTSEPDPSRLVSAARLMSGQFFVHISEEAAPLVPWDEEEAKKYVGKAWRAKGINPVQLSILGQYPGGNAWKEKSDWERDWSGFEYAEPKWGTDSCAWDWKPCAKAPAPEPVYSQLAVFARGMAAGARVKLQRTKRDGKPYAGYECEQYELGVCGAEGLNECAVTFEDAGYEVAAVLYPQYREWTSKDAKEHTGFAHRRCNVLLPGNIHMDGIIGHMSESGGRLWPADSAYWDYWGGSYYAKPVWGTCPSTWDWKPCRVITGYLTAGGKG